MGMRCNKPLLSSHIEMKWTIGHTHRGESSEKRKGNFRPCASVNICKSLWSVPSVSFSYHSFTYCSTRVACQGCSFDCWLQALDLGFGALHLNIVASHVFCVRLVWRCLWWWSGWNANSPLCVCVYVHMFNSLTLTNYPLKLVTILIQYVCHKTIC